MLEIYVTCRSKNYSDLANDLREIADKIDKQHLDYKEVCKGDERFIFNIVNVPAQPIYHENQKVYIDNSRFKFGGWKKGIVFRKPKDGITNYQILIDRIVYEIEPEFVKPRRD